MINANDLLQHAIDRDASDIFIGAPEPPVFRIHGDLHRMPMKSLGPSECKEIVYSYLTPVQRSEFEANMEFDGCFGIDHLGRFRINVHLQRGSVAASIRIIPRKIPDLEKLGLPDSVINLVERPKGLILVTGPVSSGKSTTLASMINHINQQRCAHIITVEDPIEYLHKNNKSVIEQREVNVDTPSFGQALKHVLRQDPDIIMIGEMRDTETIGAALTAAETGQCVLATLHTNDAVQSVERIVDAFSADGQNQARLQLSMTLQGVISQLLLPKKDGSGRALACEVMIVNTGIRNLIRKGDAAAMKNMITTGTGQGMNSMEQSIADLHRQGLISQQEALNRASGSGDLEQYLNGS